MRLWKLRKNLKFQTVLGTHSTDLKEQLLKKKVTVTKSVEQNTP
jgi:hypothetical protein